MDEILNAHIPVIKAKSQWKGVLCTLDISVLDNNHRGVACKEFVRNTIREKPVIRVIFLILKQLLYVCDFKEPYRGGLTSYGLFLMVVSYIQQHSSGNEALPELLVKLMAFYSIYFTYDSPIQVRTNEQIASPVFLPKLVRLI